MEKKWNRRLWAMVLALCLVFSVALTACGGDTSDPTDPPKQTDPTQGATKEVTGIEVTKQPDKVEYYVGEEFSAAGGEIKVTYSDNSTETKSMTDSEVTVSEVNTTINDDSLTAKKTVTVRFGGKSARFEVTVSHMIFTVRYDLGYEGAEGETLEVKKDSKIERPADPTRENFNFENWYSDASLTTAFDFNTPITADTTIYAKWLENAVYYDVTFELNYKGAVKATVQKVKESDVAIAPTTNPERVGYAFEGWFADEACTTAYDFAAPVAANTTVYAKWTKTVSGRNWYVFEAEDTNLNGKTGPGLSGTAGGPGMIQVSEDLGASNDRFVGYQYETGCSLEFQFNSDVSISDATIVISLSAELRDFDIDPESYKMSLNGVDIDYGTISFVGVPKGTAEDLDKIHALPFEEYVIIEGATLKEGLNVFAVTTTNDDAMSGTTMLSKAPMVDCIKIETEAVLDWARQLGLPKKNY